MSVQDTFYDPEDGSTRSLRLSLLTMDRSQVPPTNWLQFDVKNQEFYGTPAREDEGRKEYQLVRLLQILFLSLFLVCAHVCIIIFGPILDPVLFSVSLFLSLLSLPICFWLFTFLHLSPTLGSVQPFTFFSAVLTPDSLKMIFVILKEIIVNSNFH